MADLGESLSQVPQFAGLWHWSKGASFVRPPAICSYRFVKLLVILGRESAKWPIRLADGIVIRVRQLMQDSMVYFLSSDKTLRPSSALRSQAARCSWTVWNSFGDFLFSSFYSCYFSKHLHTWVSSAPNLHPVSQNNTNTYNSNFPLL